jgi:flagellar export protein FliJ
MARDPLLVLRAIRLRAVEEARQGLAARLKIEVQAIAKMDALAEATKLDRSAAVEIPESHQFLQMFANRLDAVRTERNAALAELAEARARVSEVRAIVANARTEAEAIEQLITEQKTKRAAEEGARTGHEMDDIARAAHILRRGEKNYAN